ncbi:MAG: AMP-binding protein, partial [Clostridia bacterium]|nr:AMP-binding protein [Clostridia bacterium]
MNNYDFPSIKELLYTQAQRLGDSVFLKYIKDGIIQEKSYKTVYEDSLAFCRMIRSICPSKKNIALIGETGYEYIISLTGILISGNAVVPFSPAIAVNEVMTLFKSADIDVLVYDSNFEKKAEYIKA